MNELEESLTVCLVLKDRGWILGKLAARLAEHLAYWNIKVDIAHYPSPTADVNHWMWYGDVDGGLYSRNTLFVTHVDRPAKLHVLKQRLKVADIGICMSRMTVDELVRRGIPREKLCYITPAHDGSVTPKRIVIGITTQLRLDGAKREDILLAMANTIRLDAFHFEIIGPRWEKVIPHLTAAGATARYSPGAYQKDDGEHQKIVLDRLPTFDYYLYMGFDEGSMGFLDALAAGIPTIVTPQGFHLDINGGITYAFANAAQLSAIFRTLASERQRRIDSVSGLTWTEYARLHALVWRSLLCGRQSEITALLLPQQAYTTPLPKPSRRQTFLSTSRFYTSGLRNFAAFAAEVSLCWRFHVGPRATTTRLFRLAKFITQLVLRGKVP